MASGRGRCGAMLAVRPSGAAISMSAGFRRLGTPRDSQNAENGQPRGRFPASSRLPCYNAAMRLLPLIILMLAGSMVAGEPTPAYPLWDGSESVADYAKKVGQAPPKA